MALFGKQPTPIQQVVQMRQQGTTDNQIVQALQKQGFSTQQIFDAMSQADIARVSPETGAAEAPPSAPPAPEAYPPEEPSAPAPAPAEGAYPEAYPPEAAYPADIESRINEVAEAIISEKWEDLIAEVKKIIAWKETVDTDMQKLKDDFASLKEDFNQLRQGVLGKISEYDTHMREVGSELKAVEKVFKDVIPTFTENVAELSRVAKALKKSK